MDTQRQDYIDSTIEDVKLMSLDIFQIKYDGIWARIEINNGIAEVFSRTNKLKTTLTVPTNLNCILIGEYMYGSQRAQAPERKDKFFVFDCVQQDRVDLHHLPYIERYKAAAVLLNNLTERFQLVRCFSVKSIDSAWHALKELEEGFVFRNMQSAYGEPLRRVKYEVEKVYYAVDFHAGQGKHSHHLGAISVAVRPRGAVLMRVGGGFTDEQRSEIWRDVDYYMNRRVEVSGKGEFESGALRHPNFVKWL